MIDSIMSKVKTGLIALTAIMATIMILGLTSAHAYSVEEIDMCNGYFEGSLKPHGITSAYLTTNDEAGILVKIQNPPDDVTFKFYYDDDGVEKEYTDGYSKVDVILQEGASWGIAFTTMDIDGKLPSFNPGLWTAKIYIEGEVEDIETFDIVDYSSLALMNQMVADYASLVGRYDELEESTVSEVQLMQLNNDYDDLQDDYDALEASQEGTRTMMYASIVVALAAVVVAVYFGLMKK